MPRISELYVLHRIRNLWTVYSLSCPSRCSYRSTTYRFFRPQTDVHARNRARAPTASLTAQTLHRARLVCTASPLTRCTSQLSNTVTTQLTALRLKTNTASVALRRRVIRSGDILINERPSYSKARHTCLCKSPDQRILLCQTAVTCLTSSALALPALPTSGPYSAFKQVMFVLREFTGFNLWPTVASL